METKPEGTLVKSSVEQRREQRTVRRAENLRTIKVILLTSALGEDQRARLEHEKELLETYHLRHPLRSQVRSGAT